MKWLCGGGRLGRCQAVSFSLGFGFGLCFDIFGAVKGFGQSSLRFELEFANVVDVEVMPLVLPRPRLLVSLKKF